MNEKHKKLDKRTIIENPYTVRPSYWYVGPTRLIELEGIRGYIIDNVCEPYVDLCYGKTIVEQCIPDTCFKLPSEFFNHELQDLDVDNETLLKNFIESYGFPYSPFFRCFGPSKHPLRFIEKRVSGKSALPAADVRKTDKLIEAYNVLHSSEVLGNPAWLIISEEEAKLTLKWLQDAVEKLFKHIKSLNISRDEFNYSKTEQVAATINIGCSRSAYITSKLKRCSTETPLEALLPITLTNAICNQILDTMELDADWKQCWCDDCERLFKIQRTSRHPYQTRPSPSDVRYCSDSCRKKQSIENLKNSRSLHGA